MHACVSIFKSVFVQKEKSSCKSQFDMFDVCLSATVLSIVEFDCSAKGGREEKRKRLVLDQKTERLHKIEFLSGQTWRILVLVRYRSQCNDYDVII